MSSKRPDHRPEEHDAGVSEARFRAFADHVADAYYLHDEHDGAVMDVNRRACEMLGYSHEELIGMKPQDFDMDVAHRADQFIRARIGAGKEARFDTRHRRKDGSIFPVEVRLFPYREGDRLLILAQVSDISERKRTEEAMLRLNRELRAISLCRQTLLRANHEQGLLDEICRIIVEEAGYRMAWVGFIAHDEARAIRIAASAGHDDGYIANLNLSWSGDVDQGKGPAGIAVRSGRSVYTHDIAHDPSMVRWRGPALERGYLSNIGIPLKQGETGEVFGVLSIYASEPNAFVPEEIQLLEDLTRDLSFGIAVLRDRHGHKQALDSLRDINRELGAISLCHQTLLRAGDEQDLLDEICRIVVEEAGYRMSWAGYVEQDEAKSIRPVSWAGLDSGYIENAALTWDAGSLYGQGPSGIAVRSGETVYSSDIANDPRMAPWRELALQRGFRSSAAIPLKDDDGQVFGVLTVYASKADAMTEDEIRLLGELADDMAFGIGVLRTRAERDVAAEALRRNEERYRTIFQNSPLGLFRASIEGRYVEVNPALAGMLGYASPEQMMHEINDIGAQIYADAEERRRVVARQLGASGDIMNHRNRYRHRDGSERTANLYLKTVRDAEGRPVFFEGIVEDITESRRAEDERQRLESQLVQAQKMESIGRLAGGVAHDFNNMLGAIMGYSDLALSRIEPGERIHAYIQEVRKAADRSADLTRQLLAFARKQNVAPKVLDLNAMVEGMLNMLRRLIGEDIRLDWSPGVGLWPVEMDPSQVDQILANLCVNARDAIDGIGTITIRTRNMELGPSECCDQAEFVPGDYVCLDVGDDGCGMDADMRESIFEPFFTTKGEGKGTGLGLSTVYGIVKQNEGCISIDSEPGKGTTFHLFLPRHSGTAEAAPAGEGEREGLSQGHETVLLVEDETALLRIMKLMLRECGYDVLVAASPAEAIALATARADTGGIKLLVTDMVMPEMNGRDLARSLMLLYPDMQCLFMSGYTDNTVSPEGDLGPGMDFIQKPFPMDDLAAKVREVLDGG